jgi:predicted dienelactone hydrolase
LAGAIWYPCAAAPQNVPLGSLAVDWTDSLQGVKDCPIAATKLPLVVLSHGRGGWFGGHHDTAEALADAGFVVAAINHPGDTFSDSSKRDTLAPWASRPDDIVRLLDFMLNDWKDRASIEPARVGFFGFSFGGYTGLVLAGAKPDFGRVVRFCTDTTGTCAQLHNGETPPDPPHEARIRAAVIADSPSIAFTKQNLAAIKIPLQFWRSELGGGGVGPDGTTRVADELPGKPDIHTVPAGHFAFLSPCSPQLAANLPRFCTDPPGFDRTAFHREFNTDIVGFFRQHLARDGETR